MRANQLAGFALPPGAGGWIELARDAWWGMERHGLAFGLAMAWLKTHLPHGAYLAALEEFGVEDRIARRFAARAGLVTQQIAHVTNSTGYVKSDNLSDLNQALDPQQIYPLIEASPLARLSGDKLDALCALRPAQLGPLLDLEAGTLAGRAIGDLARLNTKAFKAFLMQALGLDQPSAVVTDGAWSKAALKFRDLPLPEKQRFLKFMQMKDMLAGTGWKLVREEG